VTGDQLALQLVSEIEGLMSIYYDWRFEDFSHLQMLLAFPYLIFKSRSAIRKVGLYTRKYVVVWSFISTAIAFYNNNNNNNNMWFIKIFLAA
jgi:hypothetical protein